MVRLIGHSEWAPGVTRWSATTPGANEVSALEEIADGAGGRPGRAGKAAFEPGFDLARPPEGMRFADGNHAVLDLGLGGVRAGSWATFAIGEAG